MLGFKLGRVDLYRSWAKGRTINLFLISHIQIVQTQLSQLRSVTKLCLLILFLDLFQICLFPLLLFFARDRWGYFTSFIWHTPLETSKSPSKDFFFLQKLDFYSLINVFTYVFSSSLWRRYNVENHWIYKTGVI